MKCSAVKRSRAFFVMQSKVKQENKWSKISTSSLGQSYSIYGSDHPCLSNLVKNLRVVRVTWVTSSQGLAGIITRFNQNIEHETLYRGSRNFQNT